jgi:hypothetical protein
MIGNDRRLLSLQAAEWLILIAGVWIADSNDLRTERRDL